MRLESNLSAVRQRVNRLKSHDIPKAMRQSLTPPRWRELALKEAQATLDGLAAPDQRQFIGEFLRTLTAGPFGNPGFFLRLRTPFPGPQTIADYQAARIAVQPGDLGQNLFQPDITQFEQLMAEWVATEKNKDRRDAGKTDEDIGNWIAYEMLAPDGGHLVASGPNRGRPVREVFMPYLVDFLQRKQAAARLPAATVDTWLRAVLAAWRQMVRELFPEIFRAELRAARAELNL